MSKFSWLVAVALAVIALNGPCAPAFAQVYRLQGTGILNVDGQPFGADGEQVTFEMQLGTHNLAYTPQGDPKLRVFHPTSTIPLSVVGSMSGPFANVDPVAILAATNDDAEFNDDRLQIANGDPGAAVFIALCPTGDCINSGNAPVTPTALLDLLKTTLTDTSSWDASFGAFHTDNSANFYEVSSLSWSLAKISAVANVPTSVDVQYLPGESPMIVEGGASIPVGGVSGFPEFPTDAAAILEFSLANLPADAVITAARLNLAIEGISGAPEIEIVAYAGDGEATLDDGTASGSTLLTPSLTLSDAGDLELDVEFLQTLIGTDSHLGLRLSSPVADKYLTFATSENEFGYPLPTLFLEYVSDEIPLQGDFNDDGRVDAADYTVWRNTLGSTTQLAADANGNGEVDAADYALWKANFGQPWGGGIQASASLVATTNAVPEPSSVLLSLIGLSLAMLYRRTS